MSGDETQGAVVTSPTEAIGPEKLELSRDGEVPVGDQVRGKILTDVKRYFRQAELDETFAEPPSGEYIEENWFDFSYLERGEVVECYWVDRPYAYITILKDKSRDRHRYRVNVPTLTPLEEYVKDNLVKVLRNRLMYTDLPRDGDREGAFTAMASDIISNRAAASLEDGSLYKLLYYLIRDFVNYGPIDPIMHDPAIEDISCDGADVPIYVYHFDYRDLQSNVSFEGQNLSSFVLRLAQQAGEQISVSDPLVDGSLPDGSRIQLTFESDVSTRGSNFTIRKFAATPHTPVDLINWNTFTAEQMAYFWLAIENNRSLIFAGGTGSGKTTSMNAVSMFIPEDSKVVSIEDTRELSLPHENWVQSLTRDPVNAEGRGSIGMYELLQAALRQRPEYLVVGEIRTEQRVAFTFFQAIGTGHTAYTTIHAESMEGVLNRLENPPLSVPTQMILDLDIVSIQVQTIKDGRRVRRNQQVTEIIPGGTGGGGGAIRTLDVFRRDADQDVIEQVNDSNVLDRVAAARGWDDRQLAEELAVREEVIEYLLESDVNNFEAVTAAVHAFGNNRERVLDEIRAGTFDPMELEWEEEAS